MINFAPFLFIATLVALLFFPIWGFVITIGDLPFNLGALIGVLALGCLGLTFGRTRKELQKTLQKTVREHAEDLEESSKNKARIENLTRALKRFGEAGQIGQDLSSVLDKDQLLRRVLEAILKVARCDQGYLCLYEYNKNEYVYATGMGMDASMLKHACYSIDTPGIERILSKKQVVTLPFSRKVEQTEFFSLKAEVLDRFHTVTWVFMIPLIVENGILGVVVLYADEKSANIINNESVLFSLVVNQAAIALGSAIQCEYAVLDRLTLVYNHEYFQNRLSEEISRCQRYKTQLSMIMIDIDHFKHFNDTYGHQVGDEALKTVSKILKKNIRVVDLCARYGGEEFVLVFPETPLVGEYAGKAPEDLKDPGKVGGAVAKADTLRRMIEAHPFEVAGKKVQITASMGVAAWNWLKDKALDKSGLIKKADEELYAAKKAGRNRVSWRA